MGITIARSVGPMPQRLLKRHWRSAFAPASAQSAAQLVGRRKIGLRHRIWPRTSADLVQLFLPSSCQLFSLTSTPCFLAAFLIRLHASSRSESETPST